MTVMLPGTVGHDEATWVWGNDVLQLAIAHGPDTPPRLVAVWNTGQAAPDLDERRPAALPLLEAATIGGGREGTSGKRHVDGALAQRLRLVAHHEEITDGARVLRLELEETHEKTHEETRKETHGETHEDTPAESNGKPSERTRQDTRARGVRAEVFLELTEGIPTLRSWARLTSEQECLLEYATTAPLGGLGHGAHWEDELLLWEAANPWSGEFRWRTNTLAQRGLYDVGMHRFGQVGSKNRITLTSTGSWPTSEHLPMGIVEDSRTGDMLAWQVESNTTWHAELGDRYGDVYLTASGPTGAEHGWFARLGPRTSTATVPVTYAVVPGQGATPATLEALAAALTAHRRLRRRPHSDHVTMPVVYNDFLNGLMSDPTTDRVLPLVAAAADLGVDTYVMDAGWYDDEDGGWWDSVGQWKPSGRRFPGGLDTVMERIHSQGLGAGLWLEPEAIGVRSPIAGTLPAEAFFTRHGTRVTEWGRHQLDLRNEAARTHLDQVVDRLQSTMNLDYLKLDYNVDTGPGTHTGSDEAPAAGLAGHGEAMLEWVSALMDRYPALVVEGCAAGGSRTDAASGAVFPVQSLTDQQDPLLMPPIVAAAPLAITPEQSGIWASVDGAMGEEELAFSLATALLGRIHLAGRIDTLSRHQRDIVRSALSVYRTIRGAVAQGSPLWPLGLPGWRDELIAYGLRCKDDLYVLTWRRGESAEAELQLPINELTTGSSAQVLFPTWAREQASVDGQAGVLKVQLPHPVTARLVHVSLSAGGDLPC